MYVWFYLSIVILGRPNTHERLLTEVHVLSTYLHHFLLTVFCEEDKTCFEI